ncbi:MFS transporter (plasmid) [Deinococcus sp. KNUC1210]|uniref:MFS transporter n=1 Tax=Deinococcus sp. KNUC1210 TaxID=2917691 RepID=UPI001EEFEB93|nr:MFS transporter [Deinococcus sp. KNUC1210]ULH17837.1 MFS transporter [Deinococcus sp. KNUC1210]
MSTRPPALLPTLVPEELLMRAGAMLTLGVNVASTAGPLLAGWVAGHLSLPAVFFLNVASFTGVIVILARHAKDPDASHAPSKLSPWAAMLEGLAVVRKDVLLRSALLSYGALLVFGPSPSFILPLFGQKILGLHQGQLGTLFAAVGVGTILGALGGVASRGEGREGRFFTVGLTVWAAALGAFAWSGMLWWALVALTILGAARSVVGTSATAIFQRHAPEEQRGRVMSLNTLIPNGGRPIGDALLALLAVWLPLTLLITGCTAAVGLTGWGLSRNLHPPDVAEDSLATPNRTE